MVTKFQKAVLVMAFMTVAKVIAQMRLMPFVPSVLCSIQNIWAMEDVMDFHTTLPGVTMMVVTAVNAHAIMVNIVVVTMDTIAQVPTPVDNHKTSRMASLIMEVLWNGKCPNFLIQVVALTVQVLVPLYTLSALGLAHISICATPRSQLEVTKHTCLLV